jgi:hypothetical protein
VLTESHCSKEQLTESHCSKEQLTESHCSKEQLTESHCSKEQLTESHCSKEQLTESHCSKEQLTESHCSKEQLRTRDSWSAFVWFCNWIHYECTFNPSDDLICACVLLFLEYKLDYNARYGHYQETPLNYVMRTVPRDYRLQRVLVLECSERIGLNFNATPTEGNQNYPGVFLSKLNDNVITHTLAAHVVRCCSSSTLNDPGATHLKGTAFDKFITGWIAPDIVMDAFMERAGLDGDGIDFLTDISSQGLGILRKNYGYSNTFREILDKRAHMYCRLDHLIESIVVYKHDFRARFQPFLSEILLAPLAIIVLNYALDQKYENMQKYNYKCIMMSRSTPI